MEPTTVLDYLVSKGCDGNTVEGVLSALGIPLSMSIDDLDVLLNMWKDAQEERP